MLTFEKEVVINLPPYDVGKKVAVTDSIEQADFLEGLADGFAQFEYGDADGAQLLFIKKRLSPRTLKFMKKLAEYILDLETGE